jgi:hypothetical protein
MAGNTREERLQIMLTPDEVAALDEWRFERRMPSRASAIRELLRRGLAAEGFDRAGVKSRSNSFGVTGNNELSADADAAPDTERAAPGANGGAGRHRRK